MVTYESTLAANIRKRLALTPRTSAQRNAIRLALQELRNYRNNALINPELHKDIDDRIMKGLSELEKARPTALPTSNIIASDHVIKISLYQKILVGDWQRIDTERHLKWLQNPCLYKERLL